MSRQRVATPYTADLRRRLLFRFLDEVTSLGGVSTAWVFEHVNAITTVRLDVELTDVEVHEDDDSVGQDLYANAATDDSVVVDGRDVERVAFQVGYFDLWNYEEA